MHAGGRGGVHVARRVVDEHRPRRVDRIAFAQQREDRRIRLDQALLARHQHAFEPLQERIALACDREGLVRPVGQCVQPHALPAQFVQHCHRGVQRAAQHLRPARVVGGDHRRMRRMQRAQFGHRLLPWPPGILTLVPLRAAHLAQEGFHRCLVVEQTAVQITRVPVDEDAAKIEYHGVQVGCGRRGGCGGHDKLQEREGDAAADQACAGGGALGAAVMVAVPSG
ncbi:hypothetical protein NB706_000523 [Xanthomonas sacchari]|nr:hypothetical protein [Xanthomonas sacchari]